MEPTDAGQRMTTLHTLFGKLGGAAMLAADGNRETVIGPIKTEHVEMVNELLASPFASKWLQDFRVKIDPHLCAKGSQTLVVRYAGGT